MDVVVKRDDAASNVYTAQASLYAPGLFGGAFHADFRPVTPASPAARGETIVLYGTGRGVRNPQILAPDALPLVTIAGSPALVLYYGAAPGFAGVDQLNVTVPLDAATGSQTIVLQLGGATSNAAPLWIQ